VVAPTDAELLLDAAARLNVVWWVDLWERSWPPVPDLEQDIAVLRRARALDALVMLGTQLCQRAGAGQVEPQEILDGALVRLDRLDPTAIARYLAGPVRGDNSQGRVAATTEPYAGSDVTVTVAPVCGASTRYPSPR
jgi:hypothetical protein